MKMHGQKWPYVQECTFFSNCSIKLSMQKQNKNIYHTEFWLKLASPLLAVMAENKQFTNSANN